MKSPRKAWRYGIFRAFVSIAGDVCATLAVASVCSWVIESAALGIFLSFVVWLLGLILALALSQYLVHPTVQLVLADDKLDRFIGLAGIVGHLVADLTIEATQVLQTPAARQWLQRFKAGARRASAHPA
jgi:hypothetical protein